MGLLIGLAGRPDVLESRQLQDPQLQESLRTIFGGVDRSSGSSGWLKDMFLQRYDFLDAMFNYESMIIAANQSLVRHGKEPLYVIYPVDGLALADSTLGFVNGPNNKDRKELFIQLRDYLLTQEIQNEILNLGFRTGLIGMNTDKADKSLYNPDWGIDLARTISPITWPRAPVIEEALQLYQTAFRKPSFTAYLLDVSGSMEGEGLSELKRAMMTLLDQKLAGRYFLQASSQDVMAIIPFNNAPLAGLTVQGNDPAELNRAVNLVNGLKAGGGTNIYRPVVAALREMDRRGERLTRYLPAIILMTDGRSKSGSMGVITKAWAGMNPAFDFPPVFAVTFGKADERQLKEITQFAVGKVFDGKKHGLEQAFRKAKGYN
jgi:Ca-activated chloride channel family protein